MKPQMLFHLFYSALQHFLIHYVFGILSHNRCSMLSQAAPWWEYSDKVLWNFLVKFCFFYDDWLWCVLQSVSALQPRTHEWLWRLRIAGVQSWNSPDAERDRSLNKDKAEWEFISTMCVISVITVSFLSSVSSVCYCRVSLSTLSLLLLPCLLLSASFPFFLFPFLFCLSFSCHWLSLAPALSHSLLFSLFPFLSFPYFTSCMVWCVWLLI